MAVNGTLLLRVIRQFRRYYDRQFEALLASAGLSMREMDVVLFLANNPSCDTARDVTEFRGLATMCRGSRTATTRFHLRLETVALKKWETGLQVR